MDHGPQTMDGADRRWTMDRRRWTGQTDDGPWTADDGQDTDRGFKRLDKAWAKAKAKAKEINRQ
ncbi:MAG: hypothetical protein ABJB16_14255 [Saprospiraceae bacterium]